MRLNTGIQLA